MNMIHKPSSITVSTRPGFPAHRGRFRTACGRSCQGALARLAAVKAQVERGFGQTMAGHDQLLKAALNEAEALAWRTPYPHLLFPLLADEKAAEARKWATRQQAIWARSSPEPTQLQLAA